MVGLAGDMAIQTASRRALEGRLDGAKSVLDIDRDQ